METLTAIVEKTNDGYSAYLDIPDTGVACVGETLSELKVNLKEAYELLSEELEAVKEVTIELSLDINQIFEFFPTINKSAFAAYAGINRSLLSQYINGIKKVSEKTTIEIVEAIQNLGREYATVG